MELEKQQTELVQKKKREARSHKFVNPFHVSLAVQAKQASVVDDRHYKVSTMKVDKDLLVALPVFDYSSWQEEIDSQVDNCGMELYKRQLRQGLVKPEDFYDKHDGNFDSSGLPATVHDAKAKADELNNAIAGLAKEIGISESEELTSDLLLKRLEAHIEKVWKSQAAQVQQPITQENNQ